MVRNSVKSGSVVPSANDHERAAVRVPTCRWKPLGATDVSKYSDRSATSAPVTAPTSSTRRETSKSGPTSWLTSTLNVDPACTGYVRVTGGADVSCENW